MQPSDKLIQEVTSYLAEGGIEEGSPIHSCIQSCLRQAYIQGRADAVTESIGQLETLSASLS